MQATSTLFSVYHFMWYFLLRLGKFPSFDIAMKALLSPPTDFILLSFGKIYEFTQDMHLFYSLYDLCVSSKMSSCFLNVSFVLFAEPRLKLRSLTFAKQALNLLSYLPGPSISVWNNVRIYYCFLISVTEPWFVVYGTSSIVFFSNRLIKMKYKDEVLNDF